MPKALSLIGTPTDIGAGSRGASMGPEALRMGLMGIALNPHRLVQACAALLQRLGGQLLRAQVDALQPGADGVRLRGSAQLPMADAVVVAAGAWSRTLLQPLGLKLPLIAERGYHLTYAHTGIRLNHVVTDIEAHFAVTDMEMGPRVAGTEELGDADDAPDWRDAFATRTDRRSARFAAPGFHRSMSALGRVLPIIRVISAPASRHQS